MFCLLKDDASSEKGKTRTSAKTRTPGSAGITEKNQPSTAQGAMPSKSSDTVESAPAVKQSASSSKAKSSEKSSKGKRPKKREVFTLRISSSSTATSFTTPYDLTAVTDSSNYLTSYTEECEGQCTERQSSKVSTVPVASVSFSGTSRSSRTALMLARGGKDPYASMNQLSARAVNTHDFMTLNPCKNVLKLKEDSSAHVAVDRPSTSATSSDEGISGYRTYPVIVSVEFSIDDYVKLSKEELGFTEIDLLMARIIYGVVEEKGEFGVTVKELQVCFTIYSIIVL